MLRLRRCAIFLLSPRVMKRVMKLLVQILTFVVYWSAGIVEILLICLFVKFKQRWVFTGMFLMSITSLWVNLHVWLDISLITYATALVWKVENSVPLTKTTCLILDLFLTIWLFIILSVRVIIFNMLSQFLVRAKVYFNGGLILFLTSTSFLIGLILINTTKWLHQFIDFISVFVPRSNSFRIQHVFCGPNYVLCFVRLGAATTAHFI